MPTPPHAISVVVPAYNEENGISPVLQQLSDILAQSGWVYEIIVVNDGSKDGTADILKTRTDITLINHPTNRGYGASLKTGIRHANHDIVCITDADGSYPNERIIELATHLLSYDYDMVVGARTGENVAIPLVRRPAKWVIGRLANFVASYPIPDINSGFRIFKRGAVRGFENVLPDGFSFTTTITLSMLVNHFLVDYIPINYHVRIGKSKIKPIRDTLNFVQLIMRIALYFAPLKVFIPLSIMLLLLSFIVGLYTHLVLGRLADVMTMVLAMSAIQIAVIGLLAELINHRVPSQYRKERE